MRYCIFIVFSLITIGLRAQNFIPKDSVEIGLTQVVHSEWNDLNNDGLLDFIFISHDGKFMKVLNSDSLYLDTLFSSYQFTDIFKVDDMNNDNLLDVIMPIHHLGESKLAIFYQKQDSTFDLPYFPGGAKIKDYAIADFNNDGRKDIVFTDSLSNSDLNFLYQSSSNFELISSSSETVNISSIQILDYDNNGYKDLLYSDASADETHVFLNECEEWRDSLLFSLSYLEMDYTDFNADGKPDLLLGGTSSSKSFFSILYGESPEEIDSLSGKSYDQIFIADMNSDGIVDVSLYSSSGSQTVLSDSINQSYFWDNTDNGNVLSYGDIDWDGDLDRAILRNGYLVWMENLTVQNLAPLIPYNSFVFQKGDGDVIISWESGGDDHTPNASLTFDVFVGSDLSSNEFLSSNLDLKSAERLKVAHGNSGYQRQIFVNSLSPGEYFYGIQSVDNSFYSGFRPGPGNGNSCNQLPIECGSFIICEQISYHTYPTCDGDVDIQVAENVGWYSETYGYLGFTNHIEYTVTASDVLYTSKPDPSSCDDMQVYIITFNEPYLLNDTTICVDQTLNLQFPFDPESVVWSSESAGVISNSNFFSYQFSEAETIYYTYTFQGCTVSDSILVDVSEPVLNLVGNSFQTLRGDGVQLSASGAESYQWTPSSGLNNPNIPNPFATPNESTTYMVIGVDSIGCSAEGEVLVIVVKQAFLPNLFSPNGDGNNDVFLAYGLQNVEDFYFKIYDRSGVTVYETSSYQELTGKGWAGDYQGKMLATGVYYWKVTGSYNDGQPVLFNEKREGAIHLMR
ncbi:FG-GAP-like repeat-containing protein [Fulvivirga ligni]|uniref:FG-GAP-like repeat-containing protein n=1 Tax=Fulvivirga ligni TaxID=2904246 RepID=UPI001F22E0A8|nr:FG-GAP-like repeat-containing protein [Fulvivirga ligni]UII23815.1 gliding motility-associated C-terminal domain-containing protein [Fulvivirga ligni]